MEPSTGSTIETFRAELKIPARDGVLLAATYAAPRPPFVPRSIIGIGAATAVPRGVYQGFADSLAARGAAVVTFDYRGVGDSRPLSLAGFEARMREWAEQDIAGILDWIAVTHPGVPIGWVGNSFGGFGPGLADNGHLVRRLLAIGTMSGYWGQMHGLERYRVALLIGAAMPALSKTIGYLPGWLMGSAVDLPHGVVSEWSRWCLDPRFIAGDATLTSLQNFDNFTGQVRLTRILDDPWSSDAGVADIAALFNAARAVSVWTVSADPTAGGPVGHIGFFRSRHRDGLWQEAGRWLMLGELN